MYVVPQQSNHFKDMLEWVQKHDTLALDLETTGLKPWSDKIRLVTLGAADGEVRVLDAFAYHVVPLLQAIRDKTIVAHNATFDLSFIRAYGVRVGTCRCTATESVILGAGDRSKRHGLGQVLKRELGIEVDKTEQKSDWSGALSESQIEYAMDDVRYLLRLHKCLNSQLKARGLEEVTELENALIPVIVDMMHEGVGVDAEKWQSLMGEAVTELEQSRASLVRDLGITNVNSTQQVAIGLVANGIRLSGLTPEHLERDLLGEIDVKASVAALKAFDALPSTSAEALAKHGSEPLVERLSAYRTKKSFVSGLGSSVSEALRLSKDSRIRAMIRPLSAPTGRMSCSDPNLLAVPKRNSLVRSCIVPKPGSLLIVADYSAIELRVLSEVTQCPVMIDAFNAGADLHALTASRLADKAVHEVTKLERFRAKAVNFGFAFGMGAERFKTYALMNYNLELDIDEAFQYKNKYRETYPGVAAWQDNVGAKAPREVRTMSGRLRVFKDRKMGYCERLNTPVQGTAADGLKQAILILSESLKEYGARIILPVHDELVVECKEGVAERVLHRVVWGMKEGMQMYVKSVPVVVEAEIRRTWAE